MSDLRRSHPSMKSPLLHQRHRTKNPLHTRPSKTRHHGNANELPPLFQPRGIIPRAKMVKVDTQAGVFGHSISDLPGRRFLVSPWLAISVWSVIFIFIGLTIAGFILAYQARKEFRMRVEEQRKLLEKQASNDHPTMSSKELKSFTRKSIMVLNSSPSRHVPPYRVSVAGHIKPRNVFDRPCRDSILVAQITPQSDSFSHDDSYYEFSRQAARESFWDPASRKSIMSVASVSSMMSKIQRRRSVGFAMMEQLDDEALEEDVPKRQHRPPPSSNLRVTGRQVLGQRYMPNVPSRMSQSINFSDSYEPVTPPRRASPPIAADPIVPQLGPPAPISADEALAQYAASRSTTPAPAPSHMAPQRSNSFLRLVRRSLTAQSSPANASHSSDPLTPKNDGDIATMQPMNFFNGDYAGTLNDALMNHADSRLQPFALTHPVISEEGEDYFSARKISNAAMLMNSVDMKTQALDVHQFPRKLPQAVLNDSAMPLSPPSSNNVRPKLRISPASASPSRLEFDSGRSHSNSTSPVSSPRGPWNNRYDLPASPRDGLSSPGSTTATYTSFSSLLPHSTPATSVSSHEEIKSNTKPQPHRAEQPQPSPPLTLKRLPSLSTNPYGRRRRQNTSQSSPRDEMRMVQLKNRQENLKRNFSNPNQLQSVDQKPSVGHTSPKSAAIRRAASAQARIPLGGTMSSGGVRDSSFLH